MQKMTRRGFIGGTVAGAAAAGVALTLPAGSAGASVLTRGGTATQTEETFTGTLDGPLIAHVRDVSSGEIALFSGEREIVIRDRGLASKLAKATGGR